MFLLAALFRVAFNLGVLSALKQQVSQSFLQKRECAGQEQVCVHVHSDDQRDDRQLRAALSLWRLLLGGR